MKEKRTKIRGKIALLLAVGALTLFLSCHFVFQASADSGEAKPALSTALSPAIEILAEKLSMTKSGILGHDLCFTAADFDRAMGYECYSVTMLTLPDHAAGTLLLSEKPVKEGQVIPRGDLGDLRFVPACTVPSAAAFTYGAVGTGSQYEIECRLYLLETLNIAPVGPASAKDDVVQTFSGISYFGVFEGNDPEGDALHFEVTQYPRKGILFTDGEGGYRYAPTGGFTGKDDFSYVCVDRYGNRSAEIPVSVRVSGISSGVVYSDMREHPAGVAATTLAEKKIMTGKTLGGRYIFAPEESITREEFAAVLMTALSVAPEKADLSAYADGNDVTEVFAPYLTAAGTNGYLNDGILTAGDLLKPGDTITKAEAALLLTAAAGLSKDTVETFAPEETTLPEWAAAPVAAMQELGILQGNDAAEMLTAPMTRGDTAISVCALLEYLGK